MKQTRKPNKLRRQTRRRKHNRKLDFLGMKSFACVLRKKIIGGGNFLGEVCDFTPLTTKDFAKLDEEVFIPIHPDFNLITPKKGQCKIIEAEGGNNIVCTKICRNPTSGQNKAVIYREKDKPVAYSISKKRTNSHDDSAEKYHSFDLYDAEMRLQIYFAENGLAPNVYMYGMIDVTPSYEPTHIKLPDESMPSSTPNLSLMSSSPPKLSLMSSSPPKLSLMPSSPPKLSLMSSSPPKLSLMDLSTEMSTSDVYQVKHFSIIEQKNDFFEFLANYYSQLYSYVYYRKTHNEETLLLLKKEIDSLNITFNTLIENTMKLYNKIATHEYVFTDVKTENLVFSDSLHLWTFKTPIFTELKKIQKYKINYDGLTFSSSFLVIEEVKDEM
jgi:hypothetical protein